MTCARLSSHPGGVSSQREVVDLVDIHDRRMGAAPLHRCLTKGLLHRAVAVLVFRPRGEILLQRRSLKDTWHPGRWTLSCTGHVRAGETYRAAASRELAEELGLKADLTRLAKVLLPKLGSGSLTEWEVVTVFACRTDLPVTIDSNELEDVKSVPSRLLAKLMNGKTLTPDARILLRKCMRLVENYSRARGPV